VLEDETHEAGGLKFHALARVGTLEQAFLPETWMDKTKIGFGGAPYVIKIQDTYHLINSAYEHLTPTDFNNREPIAQLKGHASEIIKDEKGNYFISSADYPPRGINLDRLEWK